MPGRLICFVCGSPGAESGIFVRQQERGPYFPFLEHHDPPKGSRLPTPEGTVDCCRVCYSFLISQWETYERTNTPAIKRLYWLKRADNGAFTGAEMRLQGEYIAQVMGLQYQPGGFEDGGSPEASNFASETDYSSRASHQSEIRVPQYSFSGSTSKMPEKQTSASYASNVSVPRSKPAVLVDSALDLSTSKKELGKHYSRQQEDSKNHDRKCICYVCGKSHSLDGGRLINVVKPNTNEPYFPVLEKIPPSPGAEFINRNGQVRVCSGCKNVLYQQWQAYEMSATPIHLRTYKIPDELIAHVQKERNKVPVKVEEKDSKRTFICYICGISNLVDHFLSLNTLPDKSPSPSSMFFPFVRDLKRPSGAKPLRSDGSVSACIKCYGHLSYQWSVQEMEGVPVYHRQYSLSFLSQSAPAEAQPTNNIPQPKTPPTGSETIRPLNIQITTASPVMPHHTDNPVFQSTQGLLAIAPQVEPGLSTGSESQKRQQYTPPAEVTHLPLYKETKSSATIATSQSVVQAHGSSSKIKTVPHPLQQVSLIPKKICFLCGENCIISKMNYLLSYPARHDAKVANAQVEPFFPFLANREPAQGADQMSDDGTVIACKMCFYSLLKQWNEFENVKQPSASNRWMRKYQIPEYVCYVCGTKCERKYIRSLATRKFQFLKDHRVPGKTLVMDDGEKVAVCKACAYSLMQQHSEYERMMVPEDQRKYNWNQKHLTYDSAEEEDHRGEREQLDSSTEEKSHEQAVDKSGLAHGSKPAPLNMLSPAGSKLARNTATVSPVHQVNSPTNGVSSMGSSSNLNASRTSSFAAALRKLANQAKDPPDEPSSKSAPSSSPRDTPSKRGQPPPLVYNSSTTLTSPPVVTIAPTQSHPGIHSNDVRTSIERSHPTHSSSSLFEPVVKSDRDRPLSSLSRDEDRASSRDNHSQSNRRLTPHSASGTGSPMSSREDGSARGFQPYRPGDEMRHPMSTSLSMDPAAAAAAAAAYSYPAFLPPHAFPHPAFRFDDPLMLERYRMMHPPYMPYSTAGMMPHPALHPLLTSGARYPAELLPPQLAFAAQTGRLDHRSPSLLSERQRMEEEKQRELEREKEREKERELARQRAIERENERQRERTLSREQERRESLEKSRSEHSIQRDKLDESLSARFGSIIQGTPKGLGIADRYPRVSTVTSHSSGQRDEHRSSKDEAASYLISSSYSRDPQKMLEEQKYLEHEKRYSLQRQASELERTRPPPLVSPKSREDNPSRTSKSSSESGGLFRPFDSKQLSNGDDSTFSLSSSKLFHHHPVDNSDSHPVHNHEHSSHVDRKQHKSSNYSSKDKDVTRTASFSSSSSAFHSLDSRVHQSSQSFSKLSQPQPQTHHHHTNKNHSIPRTQTPPVAEMPPLKPTPGLSSNSAPLNIPSYSFATTTTTSSSKCVVETPLPCNTVVSKLDTEERRLFESRANGSLCSDSECELESVEDKSVECPPLLITSGPPLPLETTAPKMKLFKQLGLTTQKHKKDKQYDQLRKRRRRMRECSLSPIELDEEAGQSLSLLTSVNSESLCREPDYSEKCQFLSHNLKLEAITAERRKVLSQSGVKRKREEVGETGACPVNRGAQKAQSLLHSRTNKTDTSSSSSVVVVSSDQSQERSQHSRKNKSHHSSAILYPSKQHPSHQKLGKDFVQEFHNSVLESTRQKELAQRLGQSNLNSKEDPYRKTSEEVSSKSVDSGQRRSSSTEHHMSSSSSHHNKDRSQHHQHTRDRHRTTPTSVHSSHPGNSYWMQPGPYGYGFMPGFNYRAGEMWPGIGGVMESYRHHLLDEQLERHILEERMRTLRRENSELNRSGEHLSDRMEELLQVKKQQDEDRYKTQARIDGMKTLMKKIR